MGLDKKNLYVGQSPNFNSEQMEFLLYPEVTNVKNVKESKIVYM